MGFLQLQIYIDIVINFLVDGTSEVEGNLEDNIVQHPYFTLDKSEWVSGFSYSCLEEEIR